MKAAQYNTLVPGDRVVLTSNPNTVYVVESTSNGNIILEGAGAFFRDKGMGFPRDHKTVSRSMMSLASEAESLKTKRQEAQDRRDQQKRALWAVRLAGEIARAKNNL